MKVVIIALGSRGDAQPYVALGTGLRDAGHTVTVLASEDFQELITSHGLAFAAVRGSTQAVAQSMQGLLERGQMLKILRTMGKAAGDMARDAAMSGLAACQGADLIVAGLGGFSVGQALAEKLGIPLVQAYLYPFTPTRAFPSVLTPLPQTPLTAWANSLSHRLAQQMMWQTTRAADNQVRAKVLQMPSAPFFGPFGALARQGQPILYGYSPHVIPRPSDWDPTLHVTGYWFLEPEADWQPPSALLNFLQAGPPPVYIGFGSMTTGKPEETVDLAVRALARAGQRGVLYSGWAGLKKTDLPESVFLIDSTPHSWLFPRMAAVVHHGGAGTTAAGLAAGVPSIITPFFGDQPFWARRVHALGVGPKPIPLRRLTVDDLASAIQRAVTDQAMRARAASLGEHIRAERGVAQAVALIEQAYNRR